MELILMKQFWMKNLQPLFIMIMFLDCNKQIYMQAVVEEDLTIYGNGSQKEILNIKDTLNYKYCC